jgi:small subunit ribosomal protein S17
MAEEETTDNSEETQPEEPQAEVAEEAQAEAAQAPQAEMAEEAQAEAAEEPQAEVAEEAPAGDAGPSQPAAEPARRTRRQSERTKASSRSTSAQATPPREHGPGKQKTRQGVVVSDRADKSITVRIDVTRRHREYKKIVRTSNTLHAHDESNDAHIGDTVVVRESRPLSRTKRWRLVEVVERAK